MYLLCVPLKVCYTLRFCIRHIYFRKLIPNTKLNIYVVVKVESYHKKEVLKIIISEILINFFMLVIF